MSEKISFKWKDFQTTIVNSFSNFRINSQFEDVALVGDDNKVLKAHKAILSSGSEYFRSILIQHDHSHPLICLDGVNSQDIENILDFLYTGFLQIFQEDLDRFLKISKKFKLEGLLNRHEEVQSKNIKDDKHLLQDEIKNVHTFSPRRSPQKIKNENIQGIKADENIINQPVIFFSQEDFPSIEELDLTLKENIRKMGWNLFQCRICGKVFKHSGHTLDHVEVAHTEGLKFQCDFCDMSYKNRKSVRRHKSQKHLKLKKRKNLDDDPLFVSN